MDTSRDYRRMETVFVHLGQTEWKAPQEKCTNRGYSDLVTQSHCIALVPYSSGLCAIRPTPFWIADDRLTPCISTHSFKTGYVWCSTIGERHANGRKRINRQSQSFFTRVVAPSLSDQNVDVWELENPPNLEEPKGASSVPNLASLSPRMLR